MKHGCCLLCIVVFGFFIILFFGGIGILYTLYLRHHLPTNECYIEVRYAGDSGTNSTGYDNVNCSDRNVPRNGIEGHLYLPIPVDACSYISPPPEGFPTNSTWIALVYDYPACPAEMVLNIRNAGYTLIIASSKDDSHQTVTREITDTLFPIVVVEEKYANYLKENSLSFSADNPILVFVQERSIPYASGLGSAFVCSSLPILPIIILLCCCCTPKWGFEGHLQKVKQLRANFERDSCVRNKDELYVDDQGDQGESDAAAALITSVQNSDKSNFMEAALEIFAYPTSHSTSVSQESALQLLSQFPNEVDHYSQRYQYFGIFLLHNACLKGWYAVVERLVENYNSCNPKTNLYPPSICSKILAVLLKTLTWFINDHEDTSPIYKNLCLWREHNLEESLNINDGTALHCACKAGHLDIVEFLFKQGCVSVCRNAVGATPLHFACWGGHLDIVRFLVDEKSCDLTCIRTAAGLTPLHLACWKGHLDIVAFLVEKGCYSACMKKVGCKLPPLHFGCQKEQLDVVKLLIVKFGIDPASTDSKGYTPLHIACKYGHLDIVKFLVEEQHCDHLQPAAKKSSVTPLDLANSHHHLRISSFLTSPGVSRQARYEYLSRSSFPPAFKVFVMGNHSVGKSTLVRAIENRLTNTNWFSSFTDRFKRVSGVERNTAGIIPISIDSKRLGNIIMYDLAGQHEYYSSHAALLEKLVAYPGSLLMIVVDLSENENKIVQQLQYWNSFIESHCSQSGSKPDVVIVGSHADVVKLQLGNPREKSKNILKTISSSLQMPQEMIPLNCTQLASGGLTEVCTVLGNYCSQFRQEVSTDIRQNFLHAFLCQEFEGITACKVSEIVSQISMEEWDSETVSQYLTTINDKSPFVYLKNDQDVSDSWVILDQRVLLSEVNGTIFAPKNFIEHHDIASSTGVVPFSRIKENFPERIDPEMIISFMSHLEFCHLIKESEAALIRGGQLADSKEQFEKLYFFPALVSVDRPEKSCITIEQTHCKCGWSLQCIRPDQFLSLRFLHVLLLRLAFSFALAPEEDKPCPVLPRRCNVWKAGIHWQNRDGVEAIVEVVEQNTVVTVMMGCLEGSEVACARLRSEVIRMILNMKEKLIELKEIFIHPNDLSYPLKSLQLLSSFTITELAAAIAEDKQVVTSKLGQYQVMLEINKLLYFEPYTYFNPALLAELFKDENLGKKVPDRFFLDAGKVAHSKVHNLREILCHNFDELRNTFDEIVSSSFTDQMDHCYLLFRTWARCSPSPTYQALRSALDKFSVFCGRNPLNPLVPLPPQSSVLGSSDQATDDKPILIMQSCDQEDIVEDLSTIPHMSDRPRLHELQYLRCRARGKRVKVIDHVAGRWERLAHALHFDSSVIEIVRRNNFHQTEAACRDVLRRWLEGQEGTRQPVNWATLIESLLDSGFVRIAEDLRDAVQDSNAIASLAKPMPAKKSHDQSTEGSATKIIIDFSTVPDVKRKPTRGSHDQWKTTEDLSTIPQRKSVSLAHATRKSHDKDIIPHRTDRPRLGELQYLQGRGGRRVKVIEGVATKWEELGKALHFNSSVIELMRDTEDACWDILRRWLEGEEGTRQPVTWATLIDSLHEAGFADIATDLQEAIEDYPIDADVDVSFVV